MLRQLVHEPPLTFAVARRAAGLESIERVVLRALAKDPADRFESLAAFGAAFRRAASELAPEPARPQAPAESGHADVPPRRRAPTARSLAASCSTPSSRHRPHPCRTVPPASPTRSFALRACARTRSCSRLPTSGRNGRAAPSSSRPRSRTRSSTSRRPRSARAPSRTARRRPLGRRARRARALGRSRRGSSVDAFVRCAAPSRPSTSISPSGLPGTSWLRAARSPSRGRSSALTSSRPASSCSAQVLATIDELPAIAERHAAEDARDCARLVGSPLLAPPLGRGD